MLCYFYNLAKFIFLEHICWDNYPRGMCVCVCVCFYNRKGNGGVCPGQVLCSPCKVDEVGITEAVGRTWAPLPFFHSVWLCRLEAIEFLCKTRGAALCIVPGTRKPSATRDAASSSVMIIISIVAVLMIASQ